MPIKTQWRDNIPGRGENSEEVFTSAGERRQERHVTISASPAVTITNCQVTIARVAI